MIKVTATCLTLLILAACSATGSPESAGPTLDRAEIRERLADQGYPWVDDLVPTSRGDWRADAFVLGSRTTLNIDRSGRVAPFL